MGVITTEFELRAHLNIFKMRANKQGLHQFARYPAFCALYEKDAARYQLPRETVLNMACEILVETE